jgi:RND family efflux transporter MFP subunit
MAALLLALALAGAAAAGDGLVVAPREVPVERTVHAEVRAVERPAARARIGGILETLAVDEGDRVSRGEAIARVVDPELASRIAAAEARVAEAAARARQARRDLERQRTLFQDGTIAQARLDEAVRRARESANAEKAAREEAATLKARRERGAVLAPAAGRVVEVAPTAGSAVRPGALVARVAARPVRVRLAVPERHRAGLDAQGTVRVETPQGPRAARIAQIYPDIADGLIEVDVVLPEAFDAFPVGRRVPVRLTVDTRRRIVVPGDYIETRQGLSYVRRAGEGLTLVQLGERTDEGFVVLSGLRQGDRLVEP